MRGHDRARVRRWLRVDVVLATVFALLTALAVLLVGYKTFPRGQWVQVDRSTAVATEQMTRPLRAGTHIKLVADVPDIGLDRMDFRFRNVDQTDTGHVVFVVRDERGAVLGTPTVAIKDLSDEVPANILLPHVDPSTTRTVTIDVATEGAAAITALSLVGHNCFCIRSVRVVPEIRKHPFAADVATFASVTPRRSRIHIVLDRIDATHPAGFGAHALIAAIVVAGIAFSLLVGVMAAAALRAMDEPSGSPASKPLDDR